MWIIETEKQLRQEEATNNRHACPRGREGPAQDPVSYQTSTSMEYSQVYCPMAAQPFLRM